MQYFVNISKLNLSHEPMRGCILWRSAGHIYGGVGCGKNQYLFSALANPRYGPYIANIKQIEAA